MYLFFNLEKRIIDPKTLIPSNIRKNWLKKKEEKNKFILLAFGVK